MELSGSRRWWEREVAGTGGSRNGSGSSRAQQREAVGAGVGGSRSWSRKQHGTGYWKREATGVVGSGMGRQQE